MYSNVFVTYTLLDLILINKKEGPADPLASFEVNSLAHQFNPVFPYVFRPKHLAHPAEKYLLPPNLNTRIIVRQP